MAERHDYADIINRRLADMSLGDYEGLVRLASLYRRLSPLEQGVMAEGLAEAIGEIDDVGVLGDAIHLAYHLELVTESIRRAVDARKDMCWQSRALADEIGNYEAYQAHQIYTTA